jgi:DNA replication protein DnaC
LKNDICKKCNGTGWVTIKKGDVDVARRCECQKTDILLSKGEKANIPQRFLGAGLEWGYEPDKNNPMKGKTQATAKKAAQKFIKDYPSVEKGLLFQGSIGVGKTFILCSIGYELIEKKNTDVYYIDWNDLVREMRTGEGHSTRDFSQIHHLIQKLASVELLLFDELGASKVSPWVYDNIYYLFNRRYNDKKITVCATNFLDKPPADREFFSDRIGDRIRSRLYEMTDVIVIKGDDFRQKTLSGDTSKMKKYKR